LGDDHRNYSDAEKRALTERLVGIVTDIHEGALSHRELNLELLCELHRRLFEDIRFHAGQCRGPGGSSEYLEFGPNRSSHRSAVRPELEDILRRAQDSVHSCEENQEDPGYERAAFHIAVWAHSRVVQVHPFEDGNGRTSRLLLNLILVRLGLAPVVLEVPKQEYILALNHFFRTSELEPVVDLLLPCCADWLE
jgi:fido (protein-threonine AMPylation protein)